MRKLLAVLLSFVILLSVLPAVYAASTVDEENVNESKKLNLAFDMRILTEDSDGDRLLDEKVTRIQMLIAVYRLMNYEQAEDIPVATKQYYSDISLFHYGAGYAQIMTESGFIYGYGDGTYGADNPTTLNECIMILLRTAGYSGYCEWINKTPYEVAIDLGLLKNVHLSQNDIITRRDVAMILYNLMFIETLKVSGGTGNIINYSAGGEYIREVLRLDYTDGIVDGMAGVSLEGYISEDCVSVNHETYSMSRQFLNDYLGYKVRLIYNPDNSETLSIIPDDKNKSVTLDAEDLDRYENNTYFYYRSDASNKTSHYRIDRTFDAIYNGYPVFDNDYMLPEYGDVTLIDNDNDNVYDVVIINNYENFIIESYSANENLAVMKNVDLTGEHVRLYIDSYTICKIKDSEGKEITTTRINPNSVLTVQRSVDNHYIYIIVNDETISGTIEHIGNNGNKVELTVDGKKYETVPNYYLSGGELTTGVKVDMYMDTNGKVAGLVKSREGDSWQYGYIKNAWIEDNGETVGLKLLCEDGTFKMLNCSSKIIVDGEKISEPKTIVNLIYNAYNQFENTDITGYTSEIHTKRLIRYYINSEGKVTKIDTPIEHSLYDLSVPNGYSNNNCLMIRVKGYMYWKSGMRAFKSIIKDHIDIEGDIIGQETMNTFLIPSDMNHATDSDYKIKTLAQTTFSEGYYYVSGYNTSVESTECTVMAVRNKAGNANKKMMVIESIGEMIDANDEVVTAISGYVGSSYEQLPVQEGSFRLTNELKRGDIIFYDYVDNKMIINEIGYSSDKEGLLDTSDTYHPDDGGTHFNIPYRVLKAKIIRLQGNRMQVTPATQLTEMMTFPSTVIIYDSKTDKIELGSIYDVKTAETYGDDADTVFISTRSGNIDEMIAIR